MKEIMAIVRMKKTGVTKRALVETGVAGFTALKVLGRGRLVEDTTVIRPCKDKLLAMAIDDINEVEEAEQEVTSFLDDSRFFPRRLFTILAHDEDVPRIVEAITRVNITERQVGDGIILVLPVDDAIRVRTGESGDAAIW